jgi:hypothetical protein
MTAKNLTMTVASLALLFGLSLMGCSGDTTLSPQYQEPVSVMQADSGVPEDEYSSLEERAGSSRSFSRYGIGLDYTDGDGEASGYSGDSNWSENHWGLGKP